MTFNLETLKVTDGQKALATYINAETGKRVKPESIALVDALRAEFRKEPARVAEREAVVAAARERKLLAFTKAAEKAQKLAEELGLNVVDSNPVVTYEEPDRFDEVEPAPVEIPKTAKAKAALQGIAVVPEVEDDFDESDSPVDLPAPETKDTDAIDVVEAEDGWETDTAPADEPDDF